MHKEMNSIFNRLKNQSWMWSVIRWVKK